MYTSKLYSSNDVTIFKRRKRGKKRRNLGKGIICLIQVKKKNPKVGLSCGQFTFSENLIAHRGVRESLDVNNSG